MIRTLAGWVLLLSLLAAPATAETIYPLDPETLRNVFRTRDPDEEAYLTYVGTLVSQGRLPRDLVASTFDWARRKPDPKKATYFKEALIRRAAELGINLPHGTPAPEGAIEGRVTFRALLVDVPAVGVTVKLGDTKRTATTDARGRYRFENVPYGTYKMHATGVVSLVARQGTSTAVLPSPPPSTAAAQANISLR